MKKNTLEVRHSELGIEEFTISEAKYNLYQNNKGIWEFFVTLETSIALKRSNKLENIVNAKPNLEVASILQPENLNLEAGRKIIQKEGYDYNRDEHLSFFYYFTYENIEEFVLELLEVEANRIKANAEGKTIVNGSNGNNPDAELFIYNTTFFLDKNSQRTFS